MARNVLPLKFYQRARRITQLRYTVYTAAWVAVLHSCTEMSTRLAVLHSHVAGKSGAPAPPSTIAKATAASAGTIERVEYGVLFGERPRAAGLETGPEMGGSRT